MMSEIIIAIQANFKTVKKGFEFFTHNNESSSITPDLFYEGVEKILLINLFKVNSLFPNRFTTTDIHLVWSKLTNGKPFMTFTNFAEIYDTKKHHLKKVRPFTSKPTSNKFFMNSTL